MPKGYFIELPKGHDEKVYRAYLEIIKRDSGATLTFLHNSQAVYLVVRPSDPTIVKWGSLESSLRKLKEDPDFIELHFYMENV